MTTIQERNDAMVELLRADFYSREDHVVLSDDMWAELDERAAAPALPAADRIRVFARDDGAGNSQLCFIDAAGNVVCSGGGVAAPHNLLSATHPDTVASAVNQGSLIVGTAAGWDDLTIGLAAEFLRSDGVDASWSAIGAADLPAHTHSGAGQGGSLVVGTTDTDATPGSVFFAGVGGVIQEDNAHFFWDDASDYLGINMNAPAAHLEVNAATATDTAAIFQTTDDNSANNLTEWQDAAGVARASVDYRGDFTNTKTITDIAGTIIGVDSYTLHNPSANSAATVNAGRFRVESTGAFTLSSTIGVTGTAIHFGTNALSSSYGLNFQVQNFSTGTIGAAFGLFTRIRNINAGGSITNAYGAFIDNATNAGTVTNLHGLYIDDQNVGTNNWSIRTLAGNIVFNEGGDVGTDFRVESDTKTHMLFVDAGFESVLINSSADLSSTFGVVCTANTDIGVVVRGAASQAGHLVVYEEPGGANFFESSTGLAGSTTTWNQQGVDIDFYVEAVGVADAFFLRGSDGQITLGVLGAGFVRSTAGGVLSSSPLVAGDLPAHNLLGAQHGDTVVQAVSRGSLIVGTAAGWDELTHPPAGAGFALITDANDVVWDQTPLWTGQHTFGAGWLLSGGAADLDGLDLIFDGDGDTKMFSGIADDVIIVHVSGADDFQFAANVFNVLSGSNIDMADDSWIGAASNDVRIEFDSSDGDVMVGLGDAAGSDEFQVLDNANAVVFTVNSNGATAVRTTAIANAVGLYVPWLSGDADTTAYFGSTNASNNQIAVEAHSYSNTGVRGVSESSIGVTAISVSGQGVVGQSTSDRGVTAISSTGTALYANLTGAGTAIANFLDNGTTTFLVDDGGNVAVGNLAAPLRLLHVYHATDDVFVRVKTDKVNGVAGIELFNDAQQWGIACNASDLLQFRDGTAAANRLLIDTSGHVYPGGVKTQDLGLPTNEWDDFYYVTLHAGTSRLIDSPMTCPVCQAGMKKGTGGMNIRGETADYEIVFCVECGAVAVETHTKQTAEMLSARRPPPKVEFKGLRTKSQGGHDFKVMVDFIYIDAVLDDDGNLKVDAEGNVVEPGVFNSTRLGDDELAALATMKTDDERKAFLLALGEREWYAREEARTMDEHVAVLRGQHEALVAGLVGTDLLQ